MGKDAKQKKHYDNRELRGVYKLILRASNGQIARELPMDDISYRVSELRSMALSLTSEYEKSTATETIVRKFLEDKGLSNLELDLGERTEYTRGIITYSEAKQIIKPVLSKKPALKEDDITPDMVTRIFEDNKKSIINTLREKHQQEGKDATDEFLNNEFKKLLNEMIDNISSYLSVNYTVRTKAFKEIEDDFYRAGYELQGRSGMSTEELWKKYRSNEKLLRWAIDTHENNQGSPALNGISICEEILLHPNEGNKEVYDKLFDLIFSDLELARTKQPSRLYFSSSSRCHESFLCMALQNPDKLLTPEQKKAVEYEVTSIKSHEHYVGNYDIRYCILMNPSWTEEEKKQFAIDFWKNDDDYEATIDGYELGIFDELDEHIQDIGEIYNLTYEDIAYMIGDPERATTLMENIELCKMMTSVRPKSNELLSCMKPKEFSPLFLKMYCRRINETIKASAMDGQEGVESDIARGDFDDPSYEEEPKKMLAAKAYFDDNYDSVALKNIAEAIAPIYARFALTYRVVRRLLDDNGYQDIEIPIDDVTKMYGIIVFFAIKIGLIERLTDYCPDFKRKKGFIHDLLAQVCPSKVEEKIMRNITPKQKKYIKNIYPKVPFEQYRRPWLEEK